MSILIAEDNMISAIALQTYLSKCQYPHRLAKDGVEAFHLWENDKPTVLITDLEMPGMGGLELIRKIRQNELYEHTHIIAVSSSADESSFKESIESGADDYLVKPISEFELKNRLFAAFRYKRIYDSQQIMFSLSQIVGLRDTDTGRHVERVSYYCRLLAVELSQGSKYQSQLNHRLIDLLPMASTLHDVGKVGIGDDLLKKEAKYTTNEYVNMQKHTILGYEMLLNISQKYPNAEMIQLAALIAKYHHEWWDGSGYPERKSHEDIPLCARIVALADVYDALRSVRVYKNAYSHEEAKEIILRESGTHFDPEIVRSFLRLSNQFEKLYALLQ